MTSQMFPMLCGVDGCEARIQPTSETGVFVCPEPHDGDPPIFEYRTDDEILYGTITRKARR